MSDINGGSFHEVDPEPLENHEAHDHMEAENQQEAVEKGLNPPADDNNHGQPPSEAEEPGAMVEETANDADEGFHVVAAVPEAEEAAEPHIEDVQQEQTSVEDPSSAPADDCSHEQPPYEPEEPEIESLVDETMQCPAFDTAIPTIDMELPEPPAPDAPYDPEPEADIHELDDTDEAPEEREISEDDREALDAAESGDHERLVKILDSHKGAVKARDDQGRTPLHLVAKDCYVVCCKQLIKAGAELDAQDDLGQTPLHLAIYHGSLDIIDALLESGASPMVSDNDGMNALHLSALMGLYRVAEVLLMDMNFEDEEKGEDEEEELCPKCWHAPSIVNAEVEQRPVCDHPSHLTEKRDQSKRLPVDKVGLLRAKDKEGNTPLHLTAGEPDYRSMALEFCGVLHEEAPEDALAVISMRNNNNLTPMHLAAIAGNAEVIGELLDMGADPFETNDDGQNCFHLAIISGQFPAVWQILQRRIVMGEHWLPFLNAVDVEGNNAMHVACKHGNDRAALELLRHRNALDINAKNHAGDTPAVLAYKEGFDYLLRVLVANGCNEEDVTAAKADDEAKGVVRVIKNTAAGMGPDAQPQGVSCTPLICLLALLIFLGPYFFQFLERFI